MHNILRTARLAVSSTLLLASGCAASNVDSAVETGDEITGETAQAITNLTAPQSPSQRGFAAIGVERNGVVTPTCTAAFLFNDILLTHRRCVEGIAWGSRLVATNVIDRNVANREIAPFAPNVEWVAASESSALALESDLAMVRLSRPIATGRRDDVNATSGFTRRLRSTAAPITSTTDLHCFGFSYLGNRLTLRERLVRVVAPGSRTVTVWAGFGETADRSDDGGACIADDGTLAGLLRFATAGTWTLVDVSRSGWLPTEIADSFRGSAVAEQLGLWPLTYVSATSNRAIQVGLNGVANYSTRTEVIAPIWAQGFMVTSLSSTDVQLRHRGTGYCVIPTATGFGLATCITSPPAISPQRIRVTYLDDGSMQLRSTSLGTCVTEVNNDVTMRPCNTATPGQGWFQGIGRR